MKDHPTSSVDRESDFVRSPGRVAGHMHQVSCTLAMLLLSASSPALAQGRWLRASKPGQVPVVRFDRQSFEVRDGYPQVWVSIKPSRPVNTPEGKRVVEFRDFEQFDCATRKFRSRAEVAYSTDGTPVRQFDNGNFGGPWDAVVPETTGEWAFTAVCAYARGDTVVSKPRHVADSSASPP